MRTFHIAVGYEGSEKEGFGRGIHTLVVKAHIFVTRLIHFGTESRNDE